MAKLLDLRVYISYADIMAICNMWNTVIILIRYCDKYQGMDGKVYAYCGLKLKTLGTNVKVSLHQGTRAISARIHYILQRVCLSSL